MAELRSSMTLTDRVSGTLDRVYKSMNRVVSVSNRTNRVVQEQGRVSQSTASSAQALADKVERVSNATSRQSRVIERSISVSRQAEGQNNRVSKTIRKMGDESQRTSNKVRGMWGSFKGYIGGLLALTAIQRGLQSLFRTSDEYSNMQQRLKLVNDGQQTQAQLQREIYESAQRTGGAYVDMANSVAKLNMLAGSAFKSNKESLQFLEIMNKSFVVGGANAVEQQSAMLQLTQAMVSGRLQGDELRALSETSPMLLQAIEKYMNISRAELRKLASEGKITSEIVKNSMLQAGSDIEAKFKEMPMTMGRAWQMFTNFATESFRPLFELIGRAFNTEGFQRFATVASVAVQVVVNVLMVLFTLVGHAWNFLSGIGQWMAENWRTLVPIVLAFVTALALANAQLVMMKIAGVVIPFLTGAWTALNTVVAFFNMLIMTNPLVFFITLAVMAVIALMAAFMGLGETIEAVFGFIGGVIAVFGASVINIFIFLWNVAIMVVEGIANAFLWGVYGIQLAWWGLQVVFLAVMEFLANIVIDIVNWVLEKFNDLGHAIDVVFYNVGKGVAKMAESVGGVVDGLINAVIGGIEDMINSALSGINDMIALVNNIPGVDIEALGEVSLNRSNLASAARAWGESFTEPVKKAAKQFERITGLTKIAGEAPKTPEMVSLGKANYVDPWEAYNAGNDVGRGIGKGLNSAVSGTVDAVSGLLGLGKNNSVGDNFTEKFGNNGDLFNTPNFDPSMLGGGGGNPTGGKLDSVGKIEDEIDVSDEFVKLIKDVAEQKWQQNYITLKPEISNQVTVNNDSEYEDFISKFNDDLLDAVENSTAGL